MINCYVLMVFQELTNAVSGRNASRSPAHSQSPAQNHFPATGTTGQSPAGMQPFYHMQFGSPLYVYINVMLGVITISMYYCV